ncbi:MerR family transcriptional regulator [Cellulomonas endophytica]|uniref:MerR family transcriptional regulator n=1 Tax=Cellulomonas endophytica TaxID=2494735 RepID=UPI00101276A4|nr:MerR family transcriptional regulator [Cellulomonas endophytica]
MTATRTDVRSTGRRQTGPVLRTVGQVAGLTGVTVRTLHHYDAVGLLVPSGRSAAGYRLYTEPDLERLQHVVVYRRLGFPLEGIARLLDAEGDERREHLLRQRDAVVHRLDEMQGLVAAIDRALERDMTDRPATTEDLEELFGDGYDEAYAAEAQERWGDTEAWAQSRERTSGYTRADWAEVKRETEGLEADLAAALAAGQPADGDVALALAERHRGQVERHYDCPPAMHRHLADMYLADERFTRHYDDRAPGLARWLHDAIHANADRLERG